MSERRDATADSWEKDLSVDAAMAVLRWRDPGSMSVVVVMPVCALIAVGVGFALSGAGRYAMWGAAVLVLVLMLVALWWWILPMHRAAERIVERRQTPDNLR